MNKRTTRIKTSIKKPRLSKEEKAFIREQKLFQNKIKKVFISAGFEYIETRNKIFEIGNRLQNEIDTCFVYENIILVCEDTIGNPNHDHLRTKAETSREIRSNVEQFLTMLNSLNSTKFNKDLYPTTKWKIFYLYFSKKKIELTSAETQLFEPLKIADSTILEYFLKMSNSIKRSFKYEIFRYLDITKKEIGANRSGVDDKGIEVPIIHPEDVTGINEGVRIVSFMMSAGDLLKNSYVLRKDSWEDSYPLYQRLITDKRIKKIRNFVVNNKKTFFNNIIVSLPKDVRFKDQNGADLLINKIQTFESCKMSIPDKYNSIGIIDGQHRVFAYYEDDPNNQNESIIASMRDKLHLLVTGLIFPDEWSDEKKREYESDIFLQINGNAKMVDKDVILHIGMTKNRYSDESIARQVLVKMNRNGPFRDKFQLSLVEQAPIKIASIIQFALNKLVKPDVNFESLYKYWNPERSKPDILKKEEQSDNSLLDEYVDFCAKTLNEYFSAIKDTYNTEWFDKRSKILRIVSINGFIIALNNTLKKLEGVRDFNFYKNVFKNKDIDFMATDFAYSGSKYRQFSKDKIEPLLEKNEVVV